MRRRAEPAIIGALLALASGVACIEKQDEALPTVSGDAGPNEHTDQTGTNDVDVTGSELPQCNTPTFVPGVEVQETRPDGVESALVAQKARFRGRVVAQGEGLPPDAASTYRTHGWLRLEGTLEFRESYIPPAPPPAPPQRSIGYPISSDLEGNEGPADAGPVATPGSERWTVLGPRELAAIHAPIGTEIDVEVDARPRGGVFQPPPNISIVLRSGEQVLLFYTQGGVNDAGFTVSNGARTCVVSSHCFHDYERELVVTGPGMDATLAPGETRTLGDYRVWGTGGQVFEYADGLTGPELINSCVDHYSMPSQLTAILLPGGT